MLRREEREGALCLWSVGWDGTDEGGEMHFSAGSDWVLILAPRAGER